MGTIKFYVIRNLEIQGLLGLDEITRHGFNINLADGTCFQVKAGQIQINVIYREDRGVRQVTIARNVILPPQTSCDIPVKIEKVREGDLGEGIITPRTDIYRWGLSAGRVLTTAHPECITRVMNHSDQNIGLSEGEPFGNFTYTRGNPIIVSSVVENEYGKCTKEGEEVDDTMVYEDFESRNLNDCAHVKTDPGSDGMEGEGSGHRC